MKQSEQEYAASYGENCAEFYDEIYGPVAPHLISTLRDLAGGGRVLELGIGTGRVALSLAAQGVNISGAEASPAMIARLRAKPGGSEIPVIQGNFANIQITGPFSLIFALVSTFFLLRSRAEQLQCFHTVSQLLSPNGIFLIEACKPVGATMVKRENDDGSNEEHYSVDHVIETQSGPRHYQSKICYAEAQALDAMAQNAGLSLKQRWRNWQGQPWLGDGPIHISLYERSA